MEEVEVEIHTRKEVLTLFDGGYEMQPITGFGARRVPLAATLYDRLDWKSTFEVAEVAIARGERILWDLDLGLFSRLPLPLSDEAQFRACALAVDALLGEIKEKFLSSTIGVSLYRGSGDMRRGFPWEPGESDSSQKEQETLVTCRDRCWDFLRQLVVNWPSFIPLFAILDLRRLSSLTQLILLHREQLGPFCPIVRGVSPLWQFPHLGWEEWAEGGTLSRQSITPLSEIAQAHQRVKQGLLMPNDPIDPFTYPKWESLLHEIEKKGVVTRILTESCLTAEWDQLDQIIVPSRTNTLLATRALQGFEAAGGEVLRL